MAKKYSFPELKCRDCECFQQVGNIAFGTRYCNGFPKKRKPKRFSSSDPKYKAPKWCPRRLSPSVCRVYGFANEYSRTLDMITREHFDSKRDRYISVSEWRYLLRFETTTSANAKAFFEAVQCGDMDDLLEKADIQPGEVIEIDDGLKPYCFYCMSWSRMVPVFSFDRSRVQKGE